MSTLKITWAWEGKRVRFQKGDANCLWNYIGFVDIYRLNVDFKARVAEKVDERAIYDVQGSRLPALPAPLPASPLLFPCPSSPSQS